MPLSLTVDALLPAGGRIEGEFEKQAGTPIKALIRFGERTVMERTLEALRSSGRIRRAVVIGPDGDEMQAAAREADELILEGDTGPENVFRGLEWLREANGGAHADRVLIITTDLPYVTPAAISAFLDACPPDADIAVPVTEQKEFQAVFQSMTEVYVPLRDGNWMTGCAFLVNPERLLANRVHIEAIFAARKSQIAMGRLLGPVFVMRFLLHRLTVPLIEQRCEQMLGCSAAAVMGSPPELGFDLDELPEYQYAVLHPPEG